MCLVSSSDIMSKGVSLIIWPTTAKYSLILLWFYVLCQKLGKHYNGISILKRTYLHNHWFKLYELKSIRKPRRSTLLSFCNANWDFHTVKHHTANNPKLPNIAMLFKPTVKNGSLAHYSANTTTLHNIVINKNREITQIPKARVIIHNTHL